MKELPVAARGSAKEEKGEAQVSSEQSNAPEGNAGDPGFGGNTGPGTGKVAEPEQQERMPERQVIRAAEGGPVYPSDAKRQVEPKHGYADSSTDDMYAASGGRTIAGEDHIGLEDEDGGSVSASDMFEDDGGATLTAKKTVVQVFSYANATGHEERRLLVNKGQRVSRRQAEQMQAATEREQEPTFGEQREDAK